MSLPSSDKKRDYGKRSDPSHKGRRGDASRRSFLIASAIGGSIAGLPLIGNVMGAEPPGGSLMRSDRQTDRIAEQQANGQHSAVHRMVEQRASKVVRLRPISPEIENTVVQAIAADPRGKIIAVAGDDHAIRILDVESLDLLGTLQGHSDLIQTLQFDPKGRELVSAGNDGQLIVWDRDAGFQIRQRMPETPALACVRFSPDGQEMAAVGFNKSVYLMGRTKRAKQPEVECDCTDLRAVDYRDDGKILAVAGRSGSLHLFDRPTNELIGDYSIHSGRIHAIRFASSSPVVVSVGEDGAVVMFDTDAKVPVRRVNVTGGKLFSVCILDREHLAVAGSDNVIRIINAASGKEVEELVGHTGSVSTLASSGSLLFSGGYDATLRRWQLSSLLGSRDRIAERDIPIER